MAAEQKYTKEGFKKLQDEYDFLTQVRMEQIKVQIAEARSFGDLSENAEYDAAKNEQAMIEGEILEIEDKLKRAVIIKESKKGTVSLGSKVDFVEEGIDEVMTYEIVGTTEADVEQGRISNESPIGNALLGRKANDVVRVLVPAGWITLIIKKVY